MSKQEKNNPRLETFQRRWQIAICMFDVDAIIELKTSKRFDQFKKLTPPVTSF